MGGCVPESAPGGDRRTGPLDGLRRDGHTRERPAPRTRALPLTNAAA